MALQDIKRNKLISLGYTGSVPNMERDFYIAEGASGGTNRDLEMSFLAVKGFGSGALQDRWNAYLTSLGYTGAYNNKLSVFWENFFSGPPQLGYVFTGYVDVGYYTPE